MSEAATRGVIDQAVILAAGTGSRLRQHEADLPKPLHTVAGVTMLERTLTVLADAGVQRFVVVVGFMADTVRDTIGDARFLDGRARISWVDNPEYEKANGVSVLRGGSALDGPFLLSMCDHVYDVALPRRARTADMARADLFLCVDRRLDEIYDMDDATKVKTRGDAIVEIGKQLDDFDCIDTGVFAVGRALVDMLAELKAARGDCSLSDGVLGLARRERARVLDIGDAFWQDVDTPGALARAEGILTRTPRPG